MHKPGFKTLNKLARTSAMAAAAALAFVATSAHAYTTYFGEDLNNNGSVPLSSIPNSSGAETTFKSSLVGVGTETFESIPTGSSAPLTLTFPGAGTATLSGGNGQVSAVAPGTTNGVGRYSIPSASSSKFWEVTAGGSGNFNVAFSSAVAAFGFYGIDIGDFGGQLTLTLTQVGGGTFNFTVPNTIGSGGSTDGSVLFYGLIAAAGEEFTSVSFNTTTGGGDVFAFDNFTVGSAQQVCGQPGAPACPAPEPDTLPLFGLGLLSLAIALRRKLK
jgi:hypothetical protein